MPHSFHTAVADKMDKIPGAENTVETSDKNPRGLLTAFRSSAKKALTNPVTIVLAGMLAFEGAKVAYNTHKADEAKKADEHGAMVNQDNLAVILGKLGKAHYQRAEGAFTGKRLDDLKKQMQGYYEANQLKFNPLPEIDGVEFDKERTTAKFGNKHEVQVVTATSHDGITYYFMALRRNGEVLSFSFIGHEKANVEAAFKVLCYEFEDGQTETPQISADIEAGGDFTFASK